MEVFQEAMKSPGCLIDSKQTDFLQGFSLTKTQRVWTPSTAEGKITTPTWQIGDGVQGYILEGKSPAPFFIWASEDNTQASNPKAMANTK